MRRFYVENIEGDTVIIDGSEAHHIKNVLRQKIGDEVFLFDGKGNEYKAEIIEFLSFNSGPAVKLKIVSKTHKDIEPSVKINLYQSLPRLKKFDFIVEKATELGVNKIIPVISERVQLPKDVIQNPAKLARWRKIALSAAKQCGRVVVPEVTEITKFHDAVVIASPESIGVNSAKQPKTETISIIPWESEQNTTLKKVLKTANCQLSTVNLFIGPEGGFSESEIELARQNGVVPVSLGKRILRTETAPIVVIANLLYELEN